MARIVDLGKPNKGERKLIEYLNEHLGDEYTILTPSTIGHAGREREMDTLLLGPQAIFVLEAKDWKGVVSGLANGGWTSQWDSEETKHENPLDQVDKSWKVLSGFLGERLPDLNPWIQPVVVFTHRECQKAWSVGHRENIKVERLGEQLLQYISTLPTKGGRSTLSGDDHELIARAIRGKLEEAVTEVTKPWYCPSCGAENDPQARFCLMCRFDIVQHRQEQKQEQKRRAESARQEAEMVAARAVGLELCPSCGKFKNPIRSRFCGGCGVDILEYLRERRTEERLRRKRKDVLGQFFYAFIGACVSTVLFVLFNSRTSGTLGWLGLLLVFVLPPAGPFFGLKLFFGDTIDSNDTFVKAFQYNAVALGIMFVLALFRMEQIYRLLPSMLRSNNALVLIGAGILALASTFGALRGLR